MIKVQNLKKNFQLGKQKLPVLKEINLQIKNGELVSLMGPSGSGKSTLLGIMAGLDTPDSGTIYIADENISRKSEDALAAFRNDHIGIVFQAYNLIPSLIALDNVKAPLYAAKKKSSHKQINEKAKQILSDLGLEDRLNHKPNELSGGEQQRVAIARALITDPKLIIADEPTGNLDSKTGEHILGIFKKINKKHNITMVIATHSKKISSISDRTVNIIDGRIQNYKSN